MSTMMPPLSESDDPARTRGPPRVFASLAEQLETIDRIEEIVTGNKEQSVDGESRHTCFTGCC